ncbi:ImmA/IrrE family metallo-endopeptidase [Heyndrickxia ginsengihumi]|uniref:ImmA/IrrE family metallo-endopeptidase n=1 Tax=Heyndrickxia ginsengihumi TaxID=363870 RepID=UPI003D1C692A
MKDIKGVISRLAKKYQTNDPFKIAKEKDVLVIYQELGNTLGYYRSYKRIPIIHINNTLGEEMQRFVCAHELGHAMLHPSVNTSFLKNNTFFSVDKIEVEANYFATHLLLYDENLQNYETTYELLRSKGIPFEMERFI